MKVEKRAEKIEKVRAMPRKYLKTLEASTGIEPVYTDLQSAYRLNDFNTLAAEISEKPPEQEGNKA